MHDIDRNVAGEKIIVYEEARPIIRETGPFITQDISRILTRHRNSPGGLKSQYTSTLDICNNIELTFFIPTPLKVQVVSQLLTTQLYPLPNFPDDSAECPSPS